MQKAVPTISLNALSRHNDSGSDVFFADHETNNKNIRLKIPYRSDYFGIGICLSGTIGLKANLESYLVEQNCVVTMSPQIVKEWLNRSADYQTIVIFFTKEFFINNVSKQNYLDSFPFFDANAKHVTKISDPQSESIIALLDDIKLRLNSSHPYKYEIVRSLINVLLFEVSAIYNEQSFPSFYRQTRSEQIASDFKKLVCLNFIKERSVKFYADSLFITAKHLTETIKAETGKSAKGWIDEFVILEAKILLQDSSLTIQNITFMLSFTDQSTFGKFFKNIAGISPLAYRNSL
jgi:AraC family transcriptional regulator, transcriptional activator of pobA